MIRLRTFGRLELRDGAGHEIEAILKRPKRLALLVHLAAAGDVHRRDRLLALFWPDSSSERARNALNQALHILRRGLGEGVVVTRGDDDVGIDPTRLECDVVRFRRALEDGDPAAALDMYDGDFLSGFFISDAPEFEQWVEEERSELRRAAVTAALVLAEKEDSAQALEGLRRARAWDPFDERIARAMLLALVRSGDVVGALREYERFADHLRRELDLEPSAELTRLVEELRAGCARAQEEEPPLPPSPHAEGLPLVTPAAAPAGAHSPPTARSPRPWRMRAALAGAAALSILLAAGGGRRLGPEEPTRASSTGAAVRLAVLPFSVRGGEELAYLSEGAVDLLSATLDVPGAIETVEPAVVLAARSGLVDGQSEAGSSALMNRVPAEIYVEGRILQGARGIELHATLRGPGDSRAELVERVQEGESEFDGLERLARGLLAAVLGSRGESLWETAARTSGSLESVRAYLEGERLLRQERPTQAIAAFRRALSSDSSFALAHYGLAVAGRHAGDWYVSRDAVAAALRLRSSLPERERMLVEAMAAGQRGDGLGAERLLDQAVRRFPHSAQAAYELADLRFHSGYLGWAAADVRPLFQRVLEARPDDSEAALHLARLAALDRRGEELRLLERRISSANPGGLRSIEARALAAAVSSDGRRLAALLPELRALPDEPLTRVVFRVVAYSEELELTRPLAGLMLDSARARDVRMLGTILDAHLLAAAGRLVEAEVGLRALGEEAPELAARAWALVLALPLLGSGAGPEATRAGWPSLSGPHESALPVGTGLLPDRGPLAPLNRLLEEPLPGFSAGLQAVRARDKGRLLEIVEGLEGEGMGGAGADAARLLRAAAAQAYGEPSAGLKLLEEEDAVDAGDALGFRPYLMGELLSRTRPEEALRWYEALTGELHFSFLLAAPRHLRRAQVLEGLGRRELAAWHYRRFAHLWHRADEPLQPMVRSALRRHEDLRARPLAASRVGTR